jgi:ABC-type glycerol-3-phosphate transport system substrate-binding protein
MERRAFFRVLAAGSVPLLAACGAGAESADGPIAADSESVPATGTAAPRSDFAPVTVALPTGGAVGARVAIQIEQRLGELNDSAVAAGRYDHLLLDSGGRTDGLARAVERSIAEGKTPDIIYIPGEFEMDELGRAGLLAPVDELARDDAGFSMDDFVPVARDLATFDGRLLALPIWVNPTVLDYGPDYFAAAGLEPPDETWDWARFVEAARKLTGSDSQPDRNLYGFMLISFLAPSYMYMWQNDGDAVSADGARATIESPEAAGAVQYLADLVFEHQVVPPLSTQFFGGDGVVVARGSQITAEGFDVAMRPRRAGQAFGTSGGAMTLPGSGENVVAIYAGAAEGTSYTAGGAGSHFPTIESVPYPQGVRTANLANSGGMLAVSAQAADPGNAWRALRRLHEQLEPHGTVPARRVSAAELASAQVELEAPAAEVLVRAAEEARAPTWPRRAEITNLIIETVDKPVISGQLPIDAALKNATEAIDRLLSEGE